MPLGHVCQLNYDGGGRVLLETLNGDCCSLSFVRGPYLQIGQRVSFSILTLSGQNEAIDVQKVFPGVDNRPDDETLMLGRQLMQPCKWDGSERRNRKLQRSIAKFRNADLQERMELVICAEEQLSCLLNAAEIDGDAICKLVCTCSGWLHPPVGRGPGNAGKLMNCHEGDKSGEESQLQGRVRKLLIMAFINLDLTDAPTYKAVEAAVTYITVLLENFQPQSYEKVDDPNRGKKLMHGAAGQWSQLQHLLIGQHTAQTCLQADVDLQVPASKAQHRPLSARDRATCMDCSYRPNQKIINLTSVSNSETFVRLKCSHCSHIITSSWVCRHPQTGKLHVLVPQHSHAPCLTKGTKSKGRLGKKVVWQALNDMPTKRDNLGHLEFCLHNRQKSKCGDCGGLEVCKHNRRRYACHMCRTLPGKRHSIKRVHLCKMRTGLDRYVIDGFEQLCILCKL